LSYNSEIMLICDKYIAIEYNLLILDWLKDEGYIKSNKGLNRRYRNR
jgi:hypothetical protein